MNTKKIYKALGIGLLALSFVLWALLPGVPMLPVSAWWRGAIAIGVLIIAEITFWVGTLLLGKEVLVRLWNKIKHWFSTVIAIL